MSGRAVLVCGVICGEGRERAAARALLALALRRELGIAPLPRMERAPGGKPFFPDLPQVRFSLSHSHGAAVCAVHDREVGVDVELLRPAPRRLGAGMTSSPRPKRRTAAAPLTVFHSGEYFRHG